MSAPDRHDEMKPSIHLSVDPQRAETLLANIASVRSRIAKALQAHQHDRDTPSLAATKRTSPPRLIAVSKLKPASDILALYQPSRPSQQQRQCHFGENYVQELLEKSRLLPRDIRWHFIGGLQSNKCAQLAREVHNLWAVESVDSIKKAKLLNKGRGERKPQRDKAVASSKESPRTDENGGGEGQPTAEAEAEAEGKGEEESKDRPTTTTTDDDSDDRLRVFIQINTSGEESKSGVPPSSESLLELCRFVASDLECPHLKLQGFMTIGAIARSQETTKETENEDFICLRENRDYVAKELKIDPHELELSMGMSEDFEGAIVQGSDEVRVGSTIFGQRPPKKEAKVLEEREDEKE